MKRKFSIIVFITLFMITGSLSAMDAPTCDHAGLSKPLELIKNHPYATAATLGISLIAGAGYYAWCFIQGKTPPAAIEPVPSPFDVPNKPAQKNSQKWLQNRQAKLNAAKAKIK